MATIVTRAGKGSPLTNTEVDANFTNLNTDKAELSGAAFTGAITTNSTVDGRDLATDGTKLDTVETNADVTDATNVTAAGALMDSELTDIASVKALDQGVATTDSPTFAAATVTGEITANGGIALGDNDKATFGAGDDLQIYHDGSNSYIEDSGTGVLFIKGTGGVYLRGKDSDEDLGRFLENGAVDLYYNGSSKLATTSTGIDVTGTATMDGLVVDGAGDGVKATIGKTGGTNLNIYADTNTVYLAGSPALSTAYIIDQTNNNMQFKVNAAERMRIDSSGNVGIGTSSPTTRLDVRGGVNSAHATFTGQASRGLVISTANTLSNDDAVVYNAQTASSGKHIFQTGAAERMRIDSSGNVGIGQSTIIGSAAGRAALTLGGSLSSIITFGNAGTRWGGIYASAADYSIFSDSLMRFEAGGSERMRILSTGSVLFGQSVNDRPAEFAQPTGASIAGASGYLHGQYQSSVSGMNMLLNRKGTDGTILGLRKDGTDVGSIGAQSGRLTVGSNSAAGVRFDGTQLVPMSGASISDNTITLGDPGFRFKDLYLSGGVYLGGTGAANLLDDYEYGTFTPTSGVALTVISANYTKIGRQVTIVVDLEFASSTSGSYAAVSLPFTSTVNNYTGGSMNYTTYSASIASVNVESSVYFRSTSLLGGNLSYASVAGKRFIFSATYFTAS